MAPELACSDPDADDDDSRAEYLSRLNKQTDVFAFSMLALEVSDPPYVSSSMCFLESSAWGIRVDHFVIDSDRKNAAFLLAPRLACLHSSTRWRSTHTIKVLTDDLLGPHVGTFGECLGP
jgi:hypothetical protein